MQDEVQKGLEGVFVAESSLSFIDGQDGRLAYRGYTIEELSREASFEEVIFLLWHGHLPTSTELEDFSASLTQERSITPGIIDVLRELADQDESPMAALRTAVSMLSAYEPERDADPEDLEATLRKGRRITAKIPTIVAAFDRIRNGEDPISPDPELGLAGNFLYMLAGDEPSEVAAETFDMALTLHADHGLNASTFTTLVIAGTFADVYNSVTGGIGALSGQLHGGANQDVMETLIEMDESGEDPVEWTARMVEDGRRIPGFGHRVYKVKDPRAVILQEKSEELAKSSGEEKWYEYASAIETYLSDEKGLLEKGIAPNVDFYSGTVYYQLGIPIDLYTPLFAMSRVSGWVAHVLEYQADNRLIRPRARYVGPDEQDFVPLDER